jgi:hypothetical protein
MVWQSASAKTGQRSHTHLLSTQQPVVRVLFIKHEQACGGAWEYQARPTSGDVPFGSSCIHNCAFVESAPSASLNTNTPTLVTSQPTQVCSATAFQQDQSPFLNSAIAKSTSSSTTSRILTTAVSADAPKAYGTSSTADSLCVSMAYWTAQSLALNINPVTHTSRLPCVDVYERDISERCMLSDGRQVTMVHCSPALRSQQSTQITTCASSFSLRR